MTFNHQAPVRPANSLSLPLIFGFLRVERLRGMDCSGNARLHHGRSFCFPWLKSYGRSRDRFFLMHCQFCILIVSSLSILVYQLFVLLLSNFPFWLILVSNNRVCTLILVYICRYHCMSEVLHFGHAIPDWYFLS